MSETESRCDSTQLWIAWESVYSDDVSFQMVILVPVFVTISLKIYDSDTPSQSRSRNMMCQCETPSEYIGQNHNQYAFHFAFYYHVVMWMATRMCTYLFSNSHSDITFHFCTVKIQYILCAVHTAHVFVPLSCSFFFLNLHSICHV